MPTFPQTSISHAVRRALPQRPLHRRVITACLLMPTALAIGIGGATADTPVETRWTAGDQDDNWVEDGNWDEGAPVPGSDLWATINDSDAVVVLNNETGETGRLRLINGQLEVQDDGELNLELLQMYFGRMEINSDQEAAEVNSTRRSSIGTFPSNDATVVISGDDAKWIQEEEELTVGWAGEGTLRIEDGGRFEQLSSSPVVAGFREDATGTVIVDGDGSTFEAEGLLVGDAGTGTLRIENGGEVTVQEGPLSGSHEVALGVEETGDGTLIVTGDESTLDTNVLRVGQAGHGHMDILDGATVASTTNSHIASASGSTGIVSVGDNASWNTGNNFRVGNHGAGELLIEGDNALVSSRSNPILGYWSGSEGTVRVTGSGTRWEISESTTGDLNGRLRVGFLGRGHLEIDDGAEVAVQGRARIGTSDEDNPLSEAVVNGDLTAEVIDVHARGRLSGTGTVTGTTTIEGLLAPGNSIGTLTVDGDLALDDGSTFVVEVNDGGNVAGVNNDSATVSGQLDIDGGASVHVTAEDPAADGSSWAPETTYTILTANQVNGEFGSISDDFAFLFPQLSYDDENVFLTLIQGSDVASVARTPNQFAVAGAIDTATQSGGLEDIVANVIVMDEDSARASLDDLSGVDHTHAQQIALRGGQRFRAGLIGRLTGHAGASTLGETASLEQLAGVQLASAGQSRGLLGEDAETARGWWVSAEGGRGDIDDSSNATGADYRFTGLSVGFDAPISNSLHLGAAMGYVRNRADTAGGDVDVDSIHLAGYGGWQRDALYVRGSVGVGYHSADTERFVATVGQTAEADYSATGIGSRIEAGYAFEVGEAATLTPFGGLDYEYLRRNSFSESGAGAANLEVDRENEYSLRSQAGVRFDKAFETTNGYMAPYVEAAWVHEHGDRSSRMNTAFAGDTATGFTIDGPSLSRNRARIAVGLDARLNGDSFLNVGYQGEIAGSDDLHAVGVSFRRTW